MNGSLGGSPALKIEYNASGITWMHLLTSNNKTFYEFIYESCPALIGKPIPDWVQKMADSLEFPNA